jgi:hypothetical protein
MFICQPRPNSDPNQDCDKGRGNSEQLRRDEQAAASELTQGIAALESEWHLFKVSANQAMRAQQQAASQQSLRSIHSHRRSQRSL